MVKFECFQAQNGRGLFDKLRHKYEKKLLQLSHAQERPQRSAYQTVASEKDVELLNVVMKLLSFGPKHPVMTKFDSNGFLADMEDIVCSPNPDRRHGDPKKTSTECSEDMETQRDPNNMNQFRKVKKMM